MKTLQISVLGAGAMGSLFGGLLANAGQDVELLEVNPGQIAAIQRHGLLIRTDDGERRVKLPIIRPDEATRQPDWLIVFTKAMHTRGAMEMARGLIGPHTRLLSLQNGLGNAEQLQDFVDQSHIAIGMTNIPADLVALGEVHSHGEGKCRVTMVGTGQDTALAALVAALNAAGLSSVVDPEARVAIWEKVAFNSALNSLCALTRNTVGTLGATSQGRELVHAVAGEVIDVALAEGLAVSRARTLAAIDFALDQHRDHKPSMLQDLLAGRLTEIDALNGAVVRAADRHGMNVPRNALLSTLVRLAEKAG